MKHALATLLLLPLAACNGEIYLRDGVTDGDTFTLAPRALHDPDPVLQSWASYSLTRSACQLALGGDNPARDSSYDCELTAREHLLETWRERDEAVGDDYLDALDAVAQAGFLGEYVEHYLHRPDWNVPDDLRSEHFDSWRREHLRGHRPQTQIVGGWAYSSRQSFQ